MAAHDRSMRIACHHWANLILSTTLGTLLDQVEPCVR
jgi:hypothetical protein